MTNETGSRTYVVKGTPAPYGCSGAYDPEPGRIAMTNEAGQGNRAAEGRSIREFEQTASAVKAAFTSWRTLDPVRGAALTNAVDVWQAGYVDPDGDQIERIIATAKQFEAYLTGEEADG